MGLKYVMEQLGRISANTISMQYEWNWTGETLPSKKNSKRIGRKNGKPIILSSEEYLKWEKGFVKDIHSLGYSIGRFSSVIIRIRSPNKRRWDLSNKWESLADGMVEAKFLEDDSIEQCPDIRLIFEGISKEKKWEVNALFNTYEQHRKEEDI